MLKSKESPDYTRKNFQNPHVKNIYFFNIKISMEIYDVEMLR